MGQTGPLPFPHPGGGGGVGAPLFAVLGVEDSTDSSPNDHPGAIWLLLGLVEMSEPKEGASQEATMTGLLQCDTSSSEDSKRYGWTKGTDHSTGVMGSSPGPDWPGVEPSLLFIWDACLTDPMGGVGS